MRSHLAARGVYRRCAGQAESLPAVAALCLSGRPSDCVQRRARSTCGRTARSATAAATTATTVTATMKTQTRPTAVATPPTAAIASPQRRTFLGALRRAPRQLKEQQVEPGYEVLLQFRACVVEDARRPAREDLLQAFRDMFSYKLQYGKRVNATQAQWMRTLFAYLGEAGEGPGQTGAAEQEDQRQLGRTPGQAAPAVSPRRRLAWVPELTLQDLRTAREALAKRPGPGWRAGRDHLALCRLLYAELQRRGAATAMDFKRHIAVLCEYGASEEAASLLADYRGAGEAKDGGDPPSRRDKELWLVVLAGLAREGRAVMLRQQTEAALGAGLEYMPAFQEVLVSFFARRGDLTQTRAWFERPMRAVLEPTPATYRAVMAMGDAAAAAVAAEQAKKDASAASAIAAAAPDKNPHRADGRNATTAWVRTVLQQLCDANPSKPLWDVIFAWAVGSLGRGADEVDQMLATMERHNAGRPDVRPDAATINTLVAAATARGDVLLAERFVQLGIARGIAPDAQTHALQLDYRITAGDRSGAQASFVALGDAEARDGATDAEMDAQEAAMNRYVRALATQPLATTAETKSVVTRLRNAVDTVEARQVVLEARTVVALCLAFLRLDRQYDVIDVLSVHALQYSVDERAQVREALVAYIVGGRAAEAGFGAGFGSEPDTESAGAAVSATAPGGTPPSTARAWDAYSLLRQYFAETPAESRMRVMDAFFRRRRADMACMVFGHMRGAADAGLRPTADMYVRCLEGLARCPDAGGLRMVHNMLKMDTRITTDTRLLSALMLAHGAAGEADRALDFWRDISRSAEGPSYNSLAAVFYVCERLPFGDTPARVVWARLQRMDIDVPAFVYDAYCGAIAGQGHLDEAERLLDGMVRNAGYGPTATSLAIVHNALPGQDLQRDFAAWAVAQYPDLWQQVAKRGCHTTVDGLLRYKVTRALRA